MSYAFKRTRKLAFGVMLGAYIFPPHRGFIFAQPIMSMHEVVPRVVAIAVRMVMAKCRIFCQMSLFMVFDL